MNERIHVYARSTGGRVEPLQFIRNNRLYCIREVMTYQTERLPHKVLHRLKVGVLPEGTCELLFDLKSGQWLLTEAALPS